ncbi:MAG: putative fluoride ion transporter CrcB [Thermodesulfobacteriota bacterium]|nr:MAG: putative fluoride ion transporter CrcB [Thermodesulfobacteriota bacterium]
MPTILYIAIGGAAGAMLRYSISAYAYRNFHGPLPWGTLAVNLIGCFAIGVLWNVFENLAHSPNTRALIFIGILGAFTTFSTFGIESFHLFRQGEIKLGILNILISNIGGIGLVAVGYFVSKYLLKVLK